MCCWRRVYFNCHHEDANVTPPRAVKPCPWAILRGSLACPVYCLPEGRDFTLQYNFQDAVIRDRPCLPCQELQLRRRLDEEWHSFSRANLWKSSDKAMTEYIMSRQEMFNNNHFEYWEELQRAFIDSCRRDVENQEYLYGEEYVWDLREDDKWQGNSSS
ncbi:hypothetical protein F4805DRAFT_105786 [Annulohypoxylon moriforme]|nr:hypothetical protein F4805DRAFT_105786 [Annulohypoxylon moriforme]